MPDSMSPPLARVHVLLVDDDPVQRELSTIQLTELGYRVRSASNARDGLELARGETPDAIVSDVMMGDIDGFTFCRMARREPTLKSVPVVLVSARFQEDCDRELAAAVGASALVQRTPSFEAEVAALEQSLRMPVPRHTSSSPKFPELYTRSVNGQLARLVHESQAMEVKYRTLFENASDAVSLSDADGTVLEVNRRWEEVTGRSRTELVGQNVRAFAAPGHADANAARYADMVADGGGLQRLIPIARAGGGVAFMDFSTAMLEIDGKPMIFAIGRDMSEMRDALLRLEASEEKYRSLVENIPDVVWSATPQGRMTYVSPNCEPLCGYTSAEMILLHDTERFARVHPEDLAQVSAAFRALLDHKATLDCTFRKQHKNGSWRWLHARARCVLDSEGNTKRVDGVFSDVTDRRELEEQMRQAQKMEAVGQLTAGVAHDFNNILAVILANCSFLMDGLLEGDGRRNDVVEIKHAADRAATLTRQLLAFSRQQVLAPAVLELSTVVCSLEKMLRRVVSEDIELEIEHGEQVGRVLADPGQLEQVIMNLVVNARDAMPNGGKITVSTCNVERDRRYVRLRVRDTGIGMDEATQRRIFEPFFTTKGLGKGTGLGLSTCYGIVEQSHGHIEVESAPGEGATFDVYLPCVQATPSITPEAPAPRTRSGTETVLVIEDDEALGASVGRTLRKYGYRVVPVRRSEDAVAMLKSGAMPIDLVLSDVVLPGRNGIETMHEVRESMPTLKYLLMSGYADHALFDLHGVPPSHAFLMKPFTAERLVEKVREVLDAE